MRTTALLKLLPLSVAAVAIFASGFVRADSTLPRGTATYPPAIGEVHPDFSAFDQDGQGFTLIDQRGRAVVLHWCAIWCTPCQNSAEAEADFVARLDTRFGAGSWTLIDALIQDANAQPSVQVDAQNWRNILGTPARTLHAGGSAASPMYVLGEQLTSIPVYVVVDLDGIVIGVVEGFDGTTLDALEELVWDGINPPIFIDSFE